MKTIGTVTFHRAQNYGSVLQTYALQTFVCAIGQEMGQGIDYKVIDLMPNTQTSLYSIFKKGWSVTNFIKNTVALFHYKKLKRKQAKFNAFLQNYLHLTPFCDNEEKLLKISENIEYFISGSDQIWNVRSRDFEPYYYLDFTQSLNKISYAASFGPLQIDWTNYDADKYATLLRKYKAISVREEGSANNVQALIQKKPETHVDPTLLLNADDWRVLQSNENYKNGKYILLYCLEPSKVQLNMAKQISKKLHLPILITKYNNKNDLLNRFVKKYDCGPRDFLSYVDNAALVLTSSFHGTAFSLIYRKKFYVLNGKTDNRIADILNKTDLIERSIDEMADVAKVNLEKIDFEKTNTFLAEQRCSSKKYLQDALDLT